MRLYLDRQYSNIYLITLVCFYFTEEQFGDSMLLMAREGKPDTVGTRRSCGRAEVADTRKPETLTDTEADRC